ncbi:MAG: hypothetical protein DRR16_21600 [Candidatus Parabeggiatoa sp. nov. 3]|nr:MAG: hypothetical protein DRR00_31990 [Gammaproteobacteria bacterium]RKZ64153.1 MAG: hypothetical protein DRQ99_15915 [Gammaproteobacteria bacterium]RKZ81669.1 MAG: hypothetical protein DRR16_21600 [Gammaproteobacteria bacterium]HEW98582.1 hypothetical protein [Beggiatoa sp.]
MQNITLRSYVGTDRMLHLDIPVMALNMEVEVMLTVKAITLTKPFPMTRLEEGLGSLKYQGKIFGRNGTRHYQGSPTTVV